MIILIVANDPHDWPLDIPGVQVVPARAYLTDPVYGAIRSARVYNLCQSYRYQSLGYYVSLLAEARGHQALPRANTLEDLQSRNLVRLLTEGLDEQVQKALAPLKSTRFELTLCFGQHPTKRYNPLGQQLFNLLRAPLLRAMFERHGKQWRIHSLKPIAASDIPPRQQAFVLQAAHDYFLDQTRRLCKRAEPRHNLAILYDPHNPEPASNARALKKFIQAAHGMGMHAELITRADAVRLPKFDALFIRDTTFVNHYTYRFSRQADAEGLVVIDDPESILKCNNKVYLAELLARHRISTPKTLLVDKNNVRDIVPAIGLPCVLKKPDSSFSIGVKKAENEAELQARVGELLEKSELIIAQEWLPTEFDWRIGILDRQPLFAARYYMAPGHWQIIKHGEAPQDFVEGPTVAVPLADVPARVVALALKAANLIGNGFYGVDIKQAGRRCTVIEVNDNPNIDAGNEDGILKDALYRRVMRVFLQRIEARKCAAASQPALARKRKSG